MIKSILVPIDDSKYSRTALDHAIEIAKLYKAKIEILSIIDAKLFEDQHFHGIFAALGTKPFPDFKIKLQKTLEERAKEILKKAVETCQVKGVTGETYLLTGILSNTITEEAEKVDVIIMGSRGESAPRKTEFLGSTVEAVVKQANKPVMITHDKHMEIKKLLVAYDRSRLSEGALSLAADMASKGNFSIVLLTAGKKEEGKAILSKAEAYLKPYKVKVETVIKEIDPAQAIISEAKEEKCNLILMGGYGHSKFYELILGSTTEQVMRKASCPVLLCR